MMLQLLKSMCIRCCLSRARCSDLMIYKATDEGPSILPRHKLQTYLTICYTKKCLMPDLEYAIFPLKRIHQIRREVPNQE